MSLDNKSAPNEQSLLRQTFSNDDNELDLLDVIAQLWAGKKIIIISVIVALIFSGVYLAFAKEKWVSKAIVTRPTEGQVANYNIAMNALYSQSPQDKLAISDLQAQLFLHFSASLSALSNTLQNLEQPLDLKVAQITTGKEDPISVTFSAENAKQSQQQLTDYIKQVNDRVAHDYSADIKHNLAVKLGELTESLTTQESVAKEKQQLRLDVIKQALKIAQSTNLENSQLSQAEFLSDDTLYLLGTKALSSMIENEKTKPLAFSNYYYDTQRALFTIKNLKINIDNLQSFRYIMKPDLPIHRNSPKKSLVLILAVLLGTIAGSTIVLGRNMMQAHRLRKQQAQ